MPRRPFLAASLVLVLAVGALSSFAFLAAQAEGGMVDMHGGSVYMGMPMMAWLGIFLLAALAGIALITYNAAVPEIRLSEAPQPTELNKSFEVVMKMTKEDERRVLQAVKQAGGRCLQKEIVKQTGLTKLKVHRVVARLAERGLVTVKREGRTNEIALAPWLREELRS